MPITFLQLLKIYLLIPGKFGDPTIFIESWVKRIPLGNRAKYPTIKNKKNRINQQSGSLQISRHSNRIVSQYIWCLLKGSHKSISFDIWYLCSSSTPFIRSNEINIPTTFPIMPHLQLSLHPLRILSFLEVQIPTLQDPNHKSLLPQTFCLSSFLTSLVHHQQHSLYIVIQFLMHRHNFPYLTISSIVGSVFMSTYRESISFDCLHPIPLNPASGNHKSDLFFYEFVFEI